MTEQTATPELGKQWVVHSDDTKALSKAYDTLSRAGVETFNLQTGRFTAATNDSHVFDRLPENVGVIERHHTAD